MRKQVLFWPHCFNLGGGAGYGAPTQGYGSAPQQPMNGGGQFTGGYSDPGYGGGQQTGGWGDASQAPAYKYKLVVNHINNDSL